MAFYRRQHAWLLFLQLFGGWWDFGGDVHGVGDVWRWMRRALLDFFWILREPDFGNWSGDVVADVGGDYALKRKK